MISRLAGEIVNSSVKNRSAVSTTGTVEIKLPDKTAIGQCTAITPPFHKILASDVRISEMADMCGTTRRALRYYEEVGLIRPARSGAGARVYSPEDRSRVALIVTLRSMGLSSSQIVDLLDNCNTHMKLRLQKLLKARLADLHRQAAQVEKVLDDLNPEPFRLEPGP